MIDVDEFTGLTVQPVSNLLASVFVSKHRPFDRFLRNEAQRFPSLGNHFAVVILDFELGEDTLQCVCPRLIVRCETIAFWRGHVTFSNALFWCEFEFAERNCRNAPVRCRTKQSRRWEY